MFTRIFLFFILFLSFNSCGVTRNRVLIEDYYIVPNGMQVLGSDPLHVFIFENDQSIIPFRQFITHKFRSNSFFEKEFWVTIDGERYKIIVYDKDEFRKYVDSSHFIVSNLLPDNARLGNQEDFTGISMINERNEDCLKEGSLFEQLAVRYLKNLKEEYLRNGR